MAIDSANKRSSAVLPFIPWRSSFPIPDGTISAGDRQHVAFVYSGIEAAASSTLPSTPFTLAIPTREYIAQLVTRRTVTLASNIRTVGRTE